MNEQDVKNLIEAFIVANGVNAITADVLRPILIAMLTQPNDEIGDLTQLNTVTQDNLVDAINEIYNSILSITNDGIKLYQGDADPNVEPPDSYNIADFYFEEGNDLWQFNGIEWVRANSIFLQNSGYKETKFPYVGSLNFTIPENVQAIIVKKNGNPTENKENWTQLGNVVTYLGTMEAGDYLLITGVYVIPSGGGGGGGLIPDLNQVTNEGSYTSVTIQSPNAVNPSDLVPLGQVEQMLEDFPAENTNIANTDFTFTENRNQNLGTKKLSFTNGDFEVPALTLTETAENSKPNKINTADGLEVKFTDKNGINRTLVTRRTFAGTMNPPTLVELATLGIKSNNFYKHTASSQIAMYNGEQLNEWIVTVSEYNLLTIDQKNAVKYFNIIEI